MPTEAASWANSCLRKKRFPTADMAERVAQARGKQYSLPYRAYYCRHCCGWHLTKEPKNGRR